MPDVPLFEFAFAIDDERRRQRRHAPENLRQLRRGHRHRIIHLLRDDECLHFFGRHFVFGNAEDDQLVSILVLQLDEIRESRRGTADTRSPRS